MAVVVEGCFGLCCCPFIDLLDLIVFLVFVLLLCLLCVSVFVVSVFVFYRWFCC